MDPLMDKIEYIARQLAELDGMPPDMICVDIRYQPRVNTMLREVPANGQPAWTFYVREVELVLEHAKRFDEGDTGAS
jgi:hypothetical protein